MPTLTSAGSSGARVITSGQVTSGAGGAYSITGFDPGTYTLAASLGGQCGMAFATEVAISQPMVIDLHLTAAIDRFGYTCQEAPGVSFTPVSGAALSLTGDDAVTTVSLPFAFPFYDGTHTSAWVDTNGLISFTVTQRVPEIGVRLALGASPRQVFAQVIGQGIRLALVGVTIGVLAALAAATLVRGLLFDTSATDPVVYASLSVLLLTMAALACYVPARRAMRVDPMTALRNE